MLPKLSQWFLKLSKTGKTMTVIAAFVGLSAASSAFNSTPQSPTVTPLTNTGTVKAESTTKVVVTHKTLTTTEAVPYSTTNINTNNLKQGTTQIQTVGVAGVRTHVYDVTYTNGTETARTEVSNQITTEPVTEVILVGTYVEPSCPNGTYINTYGSTVCRPYASNSVPDGATARCVDGTYSFSLSRSGTCSHHGGVSIWY